MTCQGCSVKFTVFKRRVSHFVNYTNVTSSVFLLTVSVMVYCFIATAVDVVHV
jgi:hypothetical protein